MCVIKPFPRLGPSDRRVLGLRSDQTNIKRSKSTHGRTLRRTRRPLTVVVAAPTRFLIASISQLNDLIHHVAYTTGHSGYVGLLTTMPMAIHVDLIHTNMFHARDPLRDIIGHNPPWTLRLALVSTLSGVRRCPGRCNCFCSQLSPKIEIVQRTNLPFGVISCYFPQSRRSSREARRLIKWCDVSPGRT